MYLEIDFQVGLDIGSCVAFYTNFERNLIERLRRDYDGVCYDGNLIIRVLRVVRCGECAFIAPTMPTIGTLSVVFRALVVNYSPDDLIAGCVVRPIKDHGRITMNSSHANVIIIQTKEAQDVAVLDAGAVVAVRATGVLANPGSDKISVGAELYEPSATTYYFPIMAGTIEHAATSEALTRTKYVGVGSLAELFLEGEVRSHSGQITGDDYHAIDSIHGMTVVQAARDAHEYLAATMTRISKEHATLPNNIRALFYPFRKEREPASVAAAALETINLLEARIPDAATCVVVCGEYNPLDAKICVSMAPLASLPESWVRGGLAQPAGVVLARRLENFIDFAIAGAIMAIEFMDPAKLIASKSLITLQASKKK